MAEIPEQVKVFGTWASPYSRRVELALKLKGIPYEYIEENLKDKSPMLLQYNPVHKKIPVLVHNGKPVEESLIILDYIEETWKNNPLLPQDPYEKAMARFWAKFVEENILGMARKTGFLKGEEQKKAVAELVSNIKMLEDQLQGKDFFGGDRIGYLDVVGTYVAIWMVVAQEAMEGLGLMSVAQEAMGGLMSEENFPVLYKWIEKLSENDAVNECRPPREKHLEYVRSHFFAPKST